MASGAIQDHSQPAKEQLKAETGPVELTAPPITPPTDPRDVWEEEGNLPTFNLSDLLGSIPSPDPNGKSPQPLNGGKWMPEFYFQGNEAESEDSLPPETGEVDLSGLSEWQTEESPGAGETPPVVDKDEARLRWEREVLDAALSSSETGAPAQPRGAFFRAEDLGTGDLSPPGAEPVPDTPTETILNPNEVPKTHATSEPETGTPDLHAMTVQSSENLPPLDALTPLAGGATEDEEAEIAGQSASILTSLTSLDQLEPTIAGMSLLNYTCVLIPRMPTHYLTGDLSEKVGQWIHQICLAFGWRLEGIALRPEYIQWTVQVAPTISPGNVVKIVRQRTSELIFAGFDKLSQQNPSGDFWATGYLLVSGSQPPSAGLLRDFIQQTRRRQGIGKVPGEPTGRLSS
jgi:REP element-mobilizing transposase RayT